jgi:hypothetical protein
MASAALASTAATRPCATGLRAWRHEAFLAGGDRIAERFIAASRGLEPTEGLRRFKDGLKRETARSPSMLGLFRRGHDDFDQHLRAHHVGARRRASAAESVPEPASLALLGLAFGFFAGERLDPG